MANFLFDPYQTQAFLSGVVPANKQVRANWLQSFFPMDSQPVYTDTLIYDKEYISRNTIGQYVAPRVDAPMIQLQGFSSKEFRPVYTKYAMQTPDFEQIQGRQLGQGFNQLPDFSAATLNYMQRQAAVGEGGIEVLKEVQARNILLYGTHTATSALHPTVVYDFGRTKITTAADYAIGYVPEVDLTTLNANGGVGKWAWDSSGGSKAPTPYKDLEVMVRTARRRGPASRVLMSNNAYDMLEADITTNYKDAATLTLSVQNRIELKVLPEVTNFQDLTFRRTLNLLGTGGTVDIYTYEAVYNDPSVADYNSSFVKLMPNSYVVVLPDVAGRQHYGRIMLPHVNYEPMPRYIHGWQDTKTGKFEYESHHSYWLLMADPDAVVSWRVAS